MIYVVAVVVRESKAIAKLNYFHYRERIFAVFVMCVCVCVRVCVEVSWITGKSILNQNVVVLIYIAELNKTFCITTPTNNFKTLSI